MCPGRKSCPPSSAVSEEGVACLCMARSRLLAYVWLAAWVVLCVMGQRMVVGVIVTMGIANLRDLIMSNEDVLRYILMNDTKVERQQVAAAAGSRASRQQHSLTTAPAGDSASRQQLQQAGGNIGH